MNYKKIDSQDISYLKTAVSPDRVFTGEEISEDYGHDELGGVFSMPEVLIKVMDTGEVAAVMSYASEKTIPVVVRGAGTGLVGGLSLIHISMNPLVSWSWSLKKASASIWEG